jgi:hypothetical protein
MSIVASSPGWKGTAGFGDRIGIPSDPTLSNDTPAYTFSGDKKTCTIQPTNITFPLVFEKVR